MRTMKLDEIRIKNEVGSRVKFTQDEMISIALFVHDKKHLLPKYHSRHKALEKALESFSKKAPDLWRGVYAEETKLYEVGKSFSPKGYMSASENKDIAKNFAAGTKKMIHIKSVYAFPYWEWNINHLQLPQKKSDPEAFKNNDGDWMIEELKKEGEWLIGHDTKLKVVSEHNEGEYTVYEVEPAWKNESLNAHTR